MGDISVDDTPINYREIFTSLCPIYMSYGATYEDFWYGDPFKLKALREAYKIIVEQRNRELWLQGLYNYNAFAVVLSNAFSGKGKKPQTYLDRPIDIFEPSDEEKERRAKEEQRRVAEQFEAMAIAYNRSKNNGSS